VMSERPVMAQRPSGTDQRQRMPIAIHGRQS